VGKLKVADAHAKDRFKDEQILCLNYAYENGIDKPEIVKWTWPYQPKTGHSEQ
jgi:xylulose-5-phosphate/fructose-6-phosphate phosphoketolase